MDPVLLIIFKTMKKTFTLLFILFSLACYAQKRKLELRLQKDSTYYLTCRTSSTIVQNINGQQQLVSMIFGGRMSHKVIAVQDSLYVLDVQYESLSMHTSIGERSLFDVDSQDESKGDIMSELLHALLHKSKTVIITRAGKVLEIKHPDNYLSDIFAGIPQLSEAQKMQVQKQMQQFFDDNSFKASFQDAFALFSDATVGLNDKWVVNTTMEGTIIANIATTYELQNITDNNLIIHGQAQITASGDPLFRQLGGLPARFLNVAGSSSADYKIDKVTGWITYAQVTKNIKGDMVIRDNPKTPGGLTIPVTADIAFTMDSK